MLNEDLLESCLQDLGLTHLEDKLPHPGLDGAWPRLLELARGRLASHGSFESWRSLATRVPRCTPPVVELNRDAPRVEVSVSGLNEVLSGLTPWKKGPFEVGDTFIDAEWKSSLKWDRVREFASPLEGRRVLDVGTGNGYFLLRAAGDGARFTLGLEPSVLFAVQFSVLSRLYRQPAVALLPVTSQEFEPHCRAFDTVFSMGVLYHRRSPFDHLAELRSFLDPGGELVLETIVVDGPLGHCLVPEDRYAKMRNVWFLPTPSTLESWLKKVGFAHVTVSEPIPTRPEEQRATPWSGDQSLTDFLAPDDANTTIEGHPAPRRAIFVAQ